jgi:hypothetical protein
MREAEPPAQRDRQLCQVQFSPHSSAVGQPPTHSLTTFIPLCLSVAHELGVHRTSVDIDIYKRTEVECAAG